MDAAARPRPAALQVRRRDGAGTEVYVSRYTGEVRLVTTTKTRTLAWIATIPHWFYITPLRTNQPLWYWTVVVTSALGCLLALLGLVLGVTQFNKSKPFRWSNAVRYQGWMRWHYISGVFFGIFALTWVFSGLLVDGAVRLGQRRRRASISAATR